MIEKVGDVGVGADNVVQGLSKVAGRVILGGVSKSIGMDNALGLAIVWEC